MKRYGYTVLVHLNREGHLVAEDEEQARKLVRIIYEAAFPDAALVDVIDVEEVE